MQTEGQDRRVGDVYHRRCVLGVYYRRHANRTHPSPGDLMRPRFMFSSGTGVYHKLTREEVCNVQMWFQGLRVTLPGYGTIPWFGPFANSLPASDRSVVRQIE